MRTSLIFLMVVAAVTAMSTAALAQEQVSHREGTIAPMSLLTYEQVRPWAKAIKAKVIGREMPPWFIDKNVGVQHFDNDSSLTEQEIATIAKWVDAGAPRGNPVDMPAARQFPDEHAW